MADIQQVKISQLNTISDWRNSYTVATDRNGQSVKAPLEQVSKIGDLSELDTTDKSSLVAAINEAATMANITVDSQLSSTSENPVQNKVVNTALAGKQDTLVGSGTGQNIKTINNQSILGTGDIPAGEPDAVKYVFQNLLDAQKIQARANIGSASASDLAQAISDIEGIEVDVAALETAIQAINNADYVTATTLPSASAETMGHIYLIGPDENDNYDRYISQESDGVYSWVSLGSTEIDLSDITSRITAIEAKIPSAATSSNQLADKAFVNSALASKVDKVTGKGLSTNDYTNTDKGKVDSIGDLSELETEDKTSLVAAINEAATTGSGGGATLSGYVVVDSIANLPDPGQPTLGYLVGTHLYLYVGTGGDTKDGKYQDAGEFRGPQGVGFQSIASQQDGTVVITLTNGDTITIDLNHNHPQYPKYQYLTSESQMPASPESDTLYLILETSS